MIVGFGAAIGSASVGTGAVNSVKLNSRTVGIDIVHDSHGLIGLIPNPEVAGVHDDEGKLTIDLDGTGINPDSTYQFGYFVDGSVGPSGEFPYTEQEPSEMTNDEFGSAFLIANQTSTEQTLEIAYKLKTTDDDDSGDSPDTSFWFEAHNNGDQKGLITEPTNGTETATVTLSSGDACGVSFLLDVPGDTLGESINGSLAITAGEAVDDTGGDEGNPAPK